ncbi:nucleotidyltransferase domain-containing protein [Petrimonas sp.]|uniref:nucleotidyltransferase domain-containing protein n=1 Tax=Petrimonas sp. TaxID=2023866 RepID=UPI003F512C09
MTKQEKIIKSIQNLKKEVLPEGKLVLFGSRAREDATSESDWDLLILLDKKEITSSDFDQYAYPFVQLGWKFGEYFSPKLYTESEWIDRKSSFFFKNVQAEGVEL